MSIRQVLAGATLVVAAIAVQTTLTQRARVSGVGPDLVVLTVVAVAMRGDATTGAIYGFMAGLAVDFFLDSPTGLAALTYTLVGYAVATVHAGFLRSIWWVPYGLAAVGSGAAALVFAGIGVLVGQDQLLDLRVLEVGGLVALYAVPCSLAVFPIVGRMFPPAVASERWP